jgi:hypothetical protein
MTLSQRDIFLEHEARIVLGNFDLSDEDKAEVLHEWAEDYFENDLIVYRNGKKAILEGRNSALSALQSLCTQKVLAKGVKRYSPELPKTG